jgi:hypothetical protein
MELHIADGIFWSRRIKQLLVVVVVAVHRREQQHGDGEKEPEPRQPVTPSAAQKVSAVA